MTAVTRRAGAAAATTTLLAAAAAGYGMAEAQAYTIRRFDVPVLATGARPLRILHLSDLHVRRGEQRKVAWIRRLAQLRPDLVVNTGDTISDDGAISTIVSALQPLAEFPAVFVPGNNDYYVPTRPNLVGYFLRSPRPVDGRRRLPWAHLARAMVEQGWVDLTQRRTTLTITGRRVFLAGLDDPYLRRARYGAIAGQAPGDAAVRLGVMHSPEPGLLARFATDGYDLVLAGHTHGGQIRVPFGPAIVTNCGIDRARARWLHRFDDRMWFHICAGLGTNPYAPVRIACRPEASLLTLVPRQP